MKTAGTKLSPNSTMSCTSEINAFQPAEAVFQRCSVKKVFLEISQNSQETTFARVSFLFCQSLICSASQWTGFYMIGTSVIKS